MGQRSALAPRAFRLTLEVLEGRQLLASLHGGTLLPVGSPADATVAVRASDTPAGFTPSQIRQAYGFDQIGFLDGNYNNAGSGQTIAIVDAYQDPNLSNDLTQFDQAFGLPGPPSLQIVPYSPDGQPVATAPVATDGTGWGTETAMDVEWAHAIAPGANILLVEANPDNLLAAVHWAAQQPGVSVVSTSWWINETGGTGGEFAAETSYDNDFTTPSGHAGVTFVAAAGDQGVLDYPAASPNVLAVGGTYLSLADSQGDYGGESAWQGSGGGYSAYESEPAYQRGVQNSGQRSGPDVAYNAGAGIAVYDAWDFGSSGQGGWVGPYGEGGTSAGAPQWAALIAIADQGRAQEGLSVLNGATQTLPLLYQLPSSAFHAISNGGTTATGLGSPVADQVVAGLMQLPTAGPDGSALYRLDNHGNLWQSTGDGWQVIDTGVTAFAVGSGVWANTLFVLKSNGELLESTSNGSSVLDTGVTAFALGSGPVWGDSLIDLHSNGDLEQNTGNGFSVLDTGVSAFSFGSGPAWGNSLIDLHNNGVFDQSTGNGFEALSSSLN